MNVILTEISSTVIILNETHPCNRPLSAIVFCDIHGKNGMVYSFNVPIHEELDSPAVSRRAIAKVKQRLQRLVRRVTKNLLSRAPSCFGTLIRWPLWPLTFAVVSPHQSALDTRGGLWPVLLMCSQ
jgi:hypothetical protein